jgi:hypothetical protein
MKNDEGSFKILLGVLSLSCYSVCNLLYQAPEKSLRGPEQFMMNRRDMQICFCGLAEKEGE